MPVLDAPPPEQRLCKKHGRPILPSQWREGHRNTGCAKCLNTHPGYLKKKHRYETSEKGKIMDRRHYAGKAIERNKRSTTWNGGRLTPLELFMRLTGMTEEQLSFPRR